MVAASLRFSVLLFALFVSLVSGFVSVSSKNGVIASRRSNTFWGASCSRAASAVRPLHTDVPSSASTMLKMAEVPTIEREKTVRTGGPAVLDRPDTVEERSPTKQRKGMGHEAWEVRIYNDGLNTREHVARSLVQVTGMSEMNAYQTMMQAHQNGIAVVGRWVYEVAEMYHDALRKNGIICDIVPVDEER